MPASAGPHGRDVASRLARSSRRCLRRLLGNLAVESVFLDGGVSLQWWTASLSYRSLLTEVRVFVMTLLTNINADTSHREYKLLATQNSQQR